MKTFNDKIKIYKFEDLGDLKQNHFCDDYLIIVYGEEYEGTWYLFRPDEMDEDYKPYLKSNLGVTDPYELQDIIYAFNKVLKDQSYETIKANKIRHNIYNSSANTDKGIKLSTKNCKGTVGYSWRKIKRKRKKMSNDRG